jgi:hypothetical protein
MEHEPHRQHARRASLIRRKCLMRGMKMPGFRGTHSGQDIVHFITGLDTWPTSCQPSGKDKPMRYDDAKQARRNAHQKPQQGDKQS